MTPEEDSLASDTGVVASSEFLAHPPAACDVLLADGSSVRIRPTTPGDRAALEAFHAGLSLETIHFRYFSGLSKLPPLLLRRFTEVDFKRDMVLLAERAGRVVALASYHRDRGSRDTAEVAFVVADSQQGHGLGTVLLEQLAQLARERDIDRFRAETLFGNRAMLAVFRDAGFELTLEAEAATIHLNFPLADTPSSTAAHERREHLAEARSIARLVAPRSVLLAGECARLHESLRRSGFRGEIHDGAEAARSPVDVVWFAGPLQALAELVERGAADGAHALVVGKLSGEPDEPERQRFDTELRVSARRAGMRVLGPGSAGLVNTAPEVQLFAADSRLELTPGSCALACDAETLSPAVLDCARARQIGISSFVSLGRRCDVSVNDLLQFWVDDVRTRAVLLALESFGNPQKFERIAAVVSAAKPVFALSSSDAAQNELAQRAGVQLASSVEQLVEFARLSVAGARR